MRAGEKFIWIGSGIIVIFALFVGTIIALKPPPAMYKIVETPLSLEGDKIYKNEGCRACHEIFGNGGNKGPKLDAVGKRRTREWLEMYLSADRPQDIIPTKQESNYYAMPSFKKLSEGDRRLLIEYLMSLQGDDPTYEEYYKYLVAK